MKIGQYQVLHELGEGGMGVVFKATNPGDGQTIAIKMIGKASDVRLTLYQGRQRGKHPGLDPARRMLLIREAREVSRLRHPNIVRVLDYGHHCGWLYLVMEYLV